MYRVLLSVLLYWLIQQGVDATLTPSGPTVSVDCGGQRTFTCSVTGAVHGWTITGLNGLTTSGLSANGLTLANSNSRVNTTDSSGVVKTSTITITEFTTADDGGTVECIDQASTMAQGMTAVSVVPTTLASATAVMANVDQCSATLTWSEPSDSSVSTSVSCTPPSTQCSSCTSSGCTIGGLTPNTSYTFSVTRSRSGCNDSTAVSSAVMSGGPPQCGTVTVFIENNCPFFTFTAPQQGSPPPISVMVSYQLVGDSSSEVLTCPYPITHTTCELMKMPEGNYSFTLTPQYNCGSPSTACSSHTVVVPDGCKVMVDSTPIIIGVCVGVVAAIIIGVSGYGSTILIMGCTCYSSLGFLALLKCLCCPCCKGKAMKSSSKQRIDSASPVTPPAQPPAQPPADEYADPQAIRDRKERGKEDKDKIQYAAIDFSAGAGSGAGEVKIHQKEEPVIYTTVQHV